MPAKPVTKLTLSIFDSFSDVSRSRVSKEDYLKRAGVDTTKVDYAIPQSFFEKCSAKNDTRHYVWDYRTNSTFGEALCLDDLKDELVTRATAVIADFNVKPNKDQVLSIYHFTECLERDVVQGLLAKIEGKGKEFLNKRLTSGN
jgi:hypothetical protein